MNFSPDDIMCAEDGLFGLPTTVDEAGIVVIPAPFDGTTTYGTGTADGPRAIAKASVQIDLFDLQFGRIYDVGLAMTEEIPGLRDLSDRVRAVAAPILDRGMVRPEDRADIATTNELCAQAEQLVFDAVTAQLRNGKMIGMLGGEHSMSQGVIRACLDHERASDPSATIGILQIDAHMDLHPAYADMVYSHASVMRNALEMMDGVSRLVQVGIRDVAEREVEYAREQSPRIATYFDIDLWRRLDDGTSWRELCYEIVESLPQLVYITFDIDGLEPTQCPHTGTPVPGGLTFNQASMLLETLAQSGKRLVGFDLVEVAPGPAEAPEFDANVGSRILFKLCGVAAASLQR